MYTPAIFEVGEQLRLRRGEYAGGGGGAAPHEQPQVGRTSLVRTHKTRMNYWWDFCPRLVHQGIWDDGVSRGERAGACWRMFMCGQF